MRDHKYIDAQSLANERRPYQFRISKVSLTILCCLYLSVFLNLPNLYLERVGTSQLFAEFIFVFSLTYLPLYCTGLINLSLFKFTATLFFLVSALVSYFVFNFNVIVDYGVIRASFTIERQLAQELLSLRLFAWISALGILPAAMLWSNLYQLRPSRPVFRNPLTLTYIVSGPIFLLLGWSAFLIIQKSHLVYEQENNINLAVPAVVVAQTYVPVNWLFGASMYAFDHWSQSQRQTTRFDPSAHFNYRLPEQADNVFIVFVIGESARYDHMGIFGYARNTTPLLAKEKNLAFLRGDSCDTITKSSLKCMFVRPGGTIDDPVRGTPVVKEENVFKVFKSLGFSLDLFSTQGEIDFYLSTHSDYYKFRETYAAAVRNRNIPIYDHLLLPDLAASLAQHPAGKHIVVLHTMGSHYRYSARYPNSLTTFYPDCRQAHHLCSQEEIINAFDNSILYTDTFLSQIIAQLREKKAVLFYASDHGESLGENGVFLHGTPKHKAPPEQRKVPLLVWASDLWLKEPTHREAFEQISRHRDDRLWAHQTIFASMLDCLGVTSTDGGVDKKYSWCAR
jgi:KDO II ethanolaminephosphotransferase